MVLDEATGEKDTVCSDSDSEFPYFSGGNLFPAFFSHFTINCFMVQEAFKHNIFNLLQSFSIYEEQRQSLPILTLNGMIF